MKEIKLRLSSIIFVLMFGVLSASGNNKDYYSKCTANIVPTGAGLVYVKYNVQGKGSADFAESGKDNQSSAPTHKYYLTAEENAGYTFVGWSENQNATSFTYTNKANQEVSITAAENVGSATKIYYAHFRYFMAAESSLDLGNTPVAGSPVSKTMNVNFGHLSSTVISGSCTDSRFTLTIPEANTNCSGTVGVTVTFTPTAEDEAKKYSGTVTLMCGEESTSFSVSATETQATITSIKWDQSFTSLLSINNPEDIALEAIVVDLQGNTIDGASVSYSSADNSVVSINNGILHIEGDGRTTITATYASTNENEITSSSNTKQVFVSDGSVCSTFLVNETRQVSISSYTGTKSYSWTAPAASTFSFSLWKQALGTQDAKVVCKDASGNTLATYSYANGNIPTKATMQTKDLPAGTKKIEFSASGTLDKYFQNVLVEQATYLEKITTDLGNVQGDNSANATIKFKYSNVPTPIRASLEGNSDIAVSENTVGTGCGDWNDNATISLVFTPKTTGQRQYTYNGNVVLSAGANEGLKTIKIPVNITIDMPFGNLNNGFAMVYNAQELLLGGATQAYIAQWVDNPEGTMLNLVSVLQEVDGDGKKHLAKETPALLYNDEEDFYTYKVEVNPTLAPNLGTSNAFTYTGGSFSQDNDAYNYYVLGANADDKVAFYKYTGTIPAEKVVLAWEKTQGNAAPQRIDIRMAEDIATALVPVWAEEDHAADARFDGQIYTIMGLPVSSMSQPGIYIQNGKKIVVR